MNKLILLRHGQSQWNLENRFTGWKDVPLTNKGIAEAEKAGELLSSDDINIILPFFANFIFFAAPFAIKKEPLKLTDIIWSKSSILISVILASSKIPAELIVKSIIFDTR